MWMWTNGLHHFIASVVIWWWTLHLTMHIKCNVCWWALPPHWMCRCLNLCLDIWWCNLPQHWMHSCLMMKFANLLWDSRVNSNNVSVKCWQYDFEGKKSDNKWQSFQTRHGELHVNTVWQGKQHCSRAILKFHISDTEPYPTPWFLSV